MDLGAMNINRLIAFQLVAKHGNLRHASVRLNQTIPTISTRIRKLEEDLGVELFERLPNKLVLTPVGEHFLIETEAILQRAEEALETIKNPKSATGRLAISIGSDHSWYFAPRISRFLNRFPNTELSLRVHHSAEAIRALSCGDIDVSIGIFPKNVKDLDREVILESSLALVCPTGHPLLRRQPPSLSEIARNRIIALPSHAETRKLVDRAMASSSVRPKDIIEVANCQIANVMVEAGVGVAIVHSLCIGHSHSENVRWVDLGQHFGKIEFSVLFRSGATRTPLLRGLLDELSA